jgi:hypothetical protein
MIRIAPAFLLLAALAAPAAAADRNYSVPDFDRVLVEGPYIVRLVVGHPSSAVATGSRDALDRINVDVQGQTLRIRRNRAAWGGTPGADPGPVTVTLATRTLRSARLIGPARLDVAGGAGLNLEFSVEGSGTIHATAIDAERLSLGLAGSGRLDLAGTARSVAGNFQGTGDVAATGLVARNATLTTTTVGTVALTVNGPVTITANGLGDVTVGGRPVCTLRGMGASQVRCSNQR